MGFARTPSRRSSVGRPQTVKIVVEHAAASPVSRPGLSLAQSLLSKAVPGFKKAKL